MSRHRKNRKQKPSMNFPRKKHKNANPRANPKESAMGGIDNEIGAKSHIFSPRSAMKRGLSQIYLKFLQLLQKNPLTNLFSEKAPR